MKEDKILIGGRALIALGSSRNTLDIDYLVNYPDSPSAFLQEAGVDYCNAGGSEPGARFFAEIYKQEKGREIASPQSLLELKAFAFVQHCRNGHWQKADDAEYDMKFLVRKFKLTGVKIVPKYLDQGAMIEIEKIIDSVVKRENIIKESGPEFRR